MISITPPAVSGAPGLANDGHQLLSFAYDWLGRRISKKVETTKVTGTEGNFTATVETQHRVFFYDGWNLIAEFPAGATAFDPIRTYTWGLDLSGTFQGAGGVGGLLKVRNHTGETAKEVYPAYDGNGNIIAWSSLSHVGGVGAETLQKLDYDPFGNLVSREGSVPRATFGSSGPEEEIYTDRTALISHEGTKTRRFRENQLKR